MRQFNEKIMTGFTGVALILLGLTIHISSPEQLRAEKKFELFGYSDFHFKYGEQRGQTVRAFTQNRTNLILSSDFEKRWTFFLNVKFSGSFEIRSMPKPTTPLPSTAPPQIPSSLGKGKFELEEAWTRYTVSDRLEIRAGLFYAPFGYFNSIQDQAPVFITVRPPMIYDDSQRGVMPIFIIPDKANLQLSGSLQRQKFFLNYSVYIGNGMGNSVEDFKAPGNFSAGSRILLNFNEFVKLGLSCYFDKALFSSSFFKSMTDPVTGKPLPEIYEQRQLFGVDADINIGKFNLNGEFIYNNSNNNLWGKFNRKFYYVNLNMELIDKVRLYGEINYYDDKAKTPIIKRNIGKGIYKYIAGINFKPTWQTAIKTEVQYYYYLDSIRSTDTMLVSSLALIF